MRWGSSVPRLWPPWVVGLGTGSPAPPSSVGQTGEAGGLEFMGTGGFWSPQLMSHRESTQCCAGDFLTSVCCHTQGYLQGAAPRKAPGSQRKNRPGCLRGPLSPPAFVCVPLLQGKFPCFSSHPRPCGLQEQGQPHWQHHKTTDFNGNHTVRREVGGCSGGKVARPMSFPPAWAVPDALSPMLNSNSGKRAGFLWPLVQHSRSMQGCLETQ